MYRNGVIDINRDFSTVIEGDVAVVTLNISRATVKEAGEFKEILEDLRASKIIKIVVNLLQTDFVDSSIIGAMVLASRDLRSIGGDMFLVTAPEGINNMFAAAGLNRVFNIFNSIDYAVKCFKEIE